jgi:hypothetical protein
MIDSQMFRITDINESVVTAPTIGMNHRIETNFPTDNSLQGFFLHLRDDLGINFSVAFVNSKDDRFAAGAANTSGAEVRLINFDFASRKWRSAFGFWRDSVSNFQINLFDRFIGQTTKLSGFISSQIKGKKLDNLTSFSLTNFRVPIIPV